jgi:ferredoxin-NADP reductase
MVEAEVPGWRDRLYYLSGPPGMVDAYKKLLGSLGISRKQVKTDYFPGY